MSVSFPRPLLAGLVVAALVAAGCHNLDFSPRHKPGEIDIYDDLFSVSVPSDNRVVAVGYHGAAYWSDDAGVTWHKGATPTDLSLYSVSMADSDNGWAVGQLGTILRTRDGGATWTEQPNLKQEEGVHLFGVQAISPDMAWAVGEWGSRIQTKDGGATWVDHSLTVDQLHPQFVWLTVQDQEKVRAGGKVYEDVGLNDVSCLPAPSQHCWIVGEFGYIFYTDDLGEHWSRGEIVGDIHIDPITMPFNVIELRDEDRERIKKFAARIADENHLNILIDPYASPEEVQRFGNPKDPSELFDILEARISDPRVVLEEAGILSDRLRTPNKPPWDFEDFQEDDPTFLTRYLEGRTAEEPMIRVGVIQNPYLFSVTFENEHEGLIAGLGGVLMRSDDGGRKWHYLPTDRKQAFFGVWGSGKHAIAVGEKGLIRVTENAGVSWRPPTDHEFPSIFTFMRDLGFERENHLGFIVGQRGMVLRTNDGGRTWAKVLPPEEETAAGA